MIKEHTEGILGLYLTILPMFFFIGFSSGNWSAATKFIVLFPPLVIFSFVPLYLGFLAVALIYEVLRSGISGGNKEQ